MALIDIVKFNLFLEYHLPNKIFLEEVKILFNLLIAEIFIHFELTINLE